MILALIMKDIIFLVNDIINLSVLDSFLNNSILPESNQRNLIIAKYKHITDSLEIEKYDRPVLVKSSVEINASP